MNEPVTPPVQGAALAIAWKKYLKLFGSPPHGSLQQMNALAELIPSTVQRAGEPVALTLEWLEALRMKQSRLGTPKTTLR